ncbi:TY-Chap domain-containing protein [Micromonospora sp. NPDC003197]
MTAETNWGELTTQLTDLVGRLSDGMVLQLHEVARPIDGYFAQLWQRPDRLVVEVSGTATTAGDSDRRLSAEQEDDLRKSGWSLPDEEHPGHWWRELAWPAPAAGYADLAGGLVGVVRDVFGLSSPRQLAYQAWSSADGRRFAFGLGLDQLEIQYYARVADDDTPERPSGLLRRVRIGVVDHDEALGRDGRWRATETLELAELGELDHELVPIGAAAAERVTAWWRRLVERQAGTVGGPPGQDQVGPRLAVAVDTERDEQGRPIVRGPRLAEPDRSAVAAYLRTAPLVAVAYGFDPDPFDPEHPETVPLHFRTDGEWVWSESLAYFAQRYGVAPEADFLAYLARRQYQLPEVDEAAITRAAELLKGG